MLQDVILQNNLERATVKALYYYPIKSCAGIEVSHAVLTSRGIRYDRELLLVEASTHKFVTQRQYPRMALIVPRIEQETLFVHAPGMPNFTVPLVKDGPVQQAIIWRDECLVIDQGNEIAQWFSNFLGLECRLVRMAPGYVRLVDRQFAVRPVDEVSFADAYPCLVISQESLDDLNSRLELPILMNRFRPNIVLAGSGIPYMEDVVKRLQIGEIVFNNVKPCARCTIPTVNQATAEMGKEPSRTLATYRRGINGNILFGQNLIHENNGDLKVGDSVKVFSLQETKFIIEEVKEVN